MIKKDLKMPINFTPLIVSGIVLGMGMGAWIVDGVLLHQILQVHNMMSGWYYPDTLEKARYNMFFDGLFHALTFFMTASGLALLWLSMGEKAVPRSTRCLVGSMVMGFGLFNFIEGIIDHQILGIHHVVELAEQPNKFYWDMAFLFFGGVLFIFVGYMEIAWAKEEIARSTLSM